MAPCVWKVTCDDKWTKLHGEKFVRLWKKGNLPKCLHTFLQFDLFCAANAFKCDSRLVSVYIGSGY